MTDEVKQPEVKSDNDDGSLSLVEKATQTADRLEKANVEARNLLEQQAQLLNRQLLGGKSTAGSTPVVVEETPQEYAKSILSGRLTK